MNRRGIAQLVGIGIGILIALFVIYLLHRQHSELGSAPSPADPINAPPSFSRPINYPGTLRIGVPYTGKPDADIVQVLETLGRGDPCTFIPMDDLRDYSKISQFDLLYLTFANLPKPWLSRADNPDGNPLAWDEEIAAEVRTSVRSYLENGGSIYASDDQFALLSVVFPEHVDNSKCIRGGKQTVDAIVVEHGLRAIVGTNLRLKFDSPDWNPAAWKSREMKTYLEGTYQTFDGRRLQAPLLIGFPHGQGQVIFASCHDKKHVDDAEAKVLRYLVFDAISNRLNTETSLARTSDIIPLLPAETNSFLFLSIEQSLSCELFQKYLATPLNTSVEKSEDFHRFILKTGIDPRTDLKRLVLAVSKPEPGQPLPSHALFVLSGKFDPPKILTALRANISSKKDMELVEERGYDLLKITVKNQNNDVPVFFSIVDERRMVLGFKEDVLTALDQAARQKETLIRSKVVVDSLTRLHPSTVLYKLDETFLYDVKNFTGYDDPTISRWYLQLAANPIASKLFEKTTQSRTDIRIGSDIKIIMTLEAADTEQAKEIQELIGRFNVELRSLFKVMSLQFPEATPLQELASNLDVTINRRTVKVETSLSGEAIEKMVQTFPSR